jgi:hypothetical protein
MVAAASAERRKTRLGSAFGGFAHGESRRGSRSNRVRRFDVDLLEAVVLIVVARLHVWLERMYLRSTAIPLERLRLKHRVRIDRSIGCHRRHCLMHAVCLRIRQKLRGKFMGRSRVVNVGVWRAGGSAGWSERSTIRHEFLADNGSSVADALCVHLCLFRVSMSQTSLFGSQPFSIFLSIAVLLLHRYQVEYRFDFAEHERLVLGFYSWETTRAHRSFRPILSIPTSQVSLVSPDTREPAYLASA